MPESRLIDSIQNDIREIRKDGQTAAQKLSAINENLETIFEYMQTCNAERDAQEKRISKTENTLTMIAKGMKLMAGVGAVAGTGLGYAIEWFRHG